ncbi:MAG: L-threonylcarbamoyladenylate synthase [Phycisphaeraceae bacterium]
MASSALQKPDAASIRRAAAHLAAGGLVGMPTETVYGLAASAFDERAVAAVFRVKRRPRFDPLIVHVESPEQAWSLVTAWPEAAQRLAERFWPGPLTLVLPKHESVPDLVTAGLDSVAVRCPDHPVALALIQALNGPIAAPSANRFGGISPTLAEHVVEELGDEVGLILDAGPCGRGVESTVVSLLGERAVLLRPGALAVEAIEGVMGELDSPAAASDNPSIAQASPGRLERHYAPGTPMLLYIDEIPESTVMHGAVSGGCAKRVGLLTLGPDPLAESAFSWSERVCLSESGDLAEAAAGLFAALRRLDRASLDLIVAQSPREQGGLGAAIADRLRRGAVRG